MIVNIQLPDSASLERTVEVVKRVEKIAQETDGVAHTIGIPGQSFVLNAVNSNFGSMFIILDDFDHRHGMEKYSATIGQKIRKRCFDEILDAQIAVFGAPPVDGLGNAGGFKLMIEDLRGGELAALQEQPDIVAAKGLDQPGLVGLFNSFRANTPQLYIDVDRTKCKSMGVSLNDVFTALQVYLGGYYVNDFNQFGRTWQVNLQGDAKFRIRPDDVKSLKVKNSRGDMVPLGTIAEIKEIGGPVMITRYNTRTAAAINGGSLPGVSTGQVIEKMEEVANRELSGDMRFEWTELTYLQLLEGSAAIFAFIGAIILVFLVLSAQYESWSMPMAVLLVVPMCLLSACVGLWLFKLDINIFVQVGFIVLVGLAAKNAILIVETARHQKATGKSRFAAAVDASKNRLRPIIMTSFAFILGVVLLMVSHGAGFEMRRTLGVAVFLGMLGVTAFGIFLTPVFYYVIDWLADRGGGIAAREHSEAASHANAGSIGHEQRASRLRVLALIGRVSIAKRLPSVLGHRSEAERQDRRDFRGEQHASVPIQPAGRWGPRVTKHRRDQRQNCDDKREAGHGGRSKQRTGSLVRFGGRAGSSVCRIR